VRGEGCGDSRSQLIKSALNERASWNPERGIQRAQYIRRSEKAATSVRPRVLSRLTYHAAVRAADDESLIIAREFRVSICHRQTSVFPFSPIVGARLPLAPAVSWRLLTRYSRCALSSGCTFIHNAGRRGAARRESHEESPKCCAVDSDKSYSRPAAPRDPHCDDWEMNQRRNTLPSLFVPRMRVCIGIRARSLDPEVTPPRSSGARRLSSRSDDTNKNIPSGDPKSLPRIVKSLSDRVRPLDLLQAASDASARVAKETKKEPRERQKTKQEKKKEENAQQRASPLPERGEGKKARERKVSRLPSRLSRARSIRVTIALSRGIIILRGRK